MISLFHSALSLPHAELCFSFSARFLENTHVERLMKALFARSFLCNCKKRIDPIFSWCVLLVKVKKRPLTVKQQACGLLLHLSLEHFMTSFLFTI